MSDEHDVVNDFVGPGSGPLDGLQDLGYEDSEAILTDEEFDAIDFEYEHDDDYELEGEYDFDVRGMVEDQLGEIDAEYDQWQERREEYDARQDAVEAVEEAAEWEQAEELVASTADGWATATSTPSRS